jgi:transcriptional regulator with XRE-family HTH domain
VGRPRQSPNSPLPKLTVARIERLRRGLSLHTISTVTTIPIGTLSDIERGTRVPSDEDLAALARVYGYAEPRTLLREAVLVPVPPSVERHP